MTDIRKKLIKLISASPCHGSGESLGSCPDRKYGMCGEIANLSYCVIQNLVNHLIANGVTVQECNVGDTIYEADGEHGVVKHDVYEICVVFKTTAADDKGNEWDDYWTSDDIGGAFKTRNEAEAHLPPPPKGE